VHCLDCRNHRKTTPSYQSKAPASPNEHGLFNCIKCASIRITEYCEKCTQRRGIDREKQTEDYRSVLWERIVKIGCCCERCKQSFIKKLDGIGFIVVKGSLDEIGLTQDNVEYLNLEFDHLSKDEQLARFGEYYGSKKNGVAQIDSYETMKTEAEKCMLLCMLCHRIMTAERLGKATTYSRLVKEKIEYVKAKKVEIGACQICGLLVDPSCFSYFEMDHIDPSTKREGISKIASQSNVVFTMKYLIEEMDMCRLVCAFCHKIHSNIQRKQNNAIVREKKVARFNTALNAYNTMQTQKKRARTEQLMFEWKKEWPE